MDLKQYLVKEQIPGGFTFNNFSGDLDAQFMEWDFGLYALRNDCEFCLLKIMEMVR